MGNLTRSATLGLDAFEADPLELRPYATEDKLQTIIRAVYKVVNYNQMSQAVKTIHKAGGKILSITEIV